MNAWKRSVFSVYIQCVLLHQLSYAFSLVLLETNGRQLAVSFKGCACHYVVPPTTTRFSLVFMYDPFLIHSGLCGGVTTPKKMIITDHIAYEYADTS